MCVLKVVVPTSEHRVQFRNDTGETVSAGAPRLGTYPLSYRVQTLAPHPALSRLEVTFGYGAVAYSDTDLHRADLAPSRAHDSRFRGNDTEKCLPHLVRAAAPASKRSVEIIARV